MAYGDLKMVVLLRLQINLLVKNENMSNKKLAKELHKPILRKFEKSTLTFYRQYFGC